MAEQRLDDADIDTVFEQVGGKAVAECSATIWMRS